MPLSTPAFRALRHPECAVLPIGIIMDMPERWARQSSLAQARERRAAQDLSAATAIIFWPSEGLAFVLFFAYNLPAVHSLTRQSFFDRSNAKGQRMKEIHVQTIADAVARLCIQACCDLPADVLAAFAAAKEADPSPAARDILGQLIENAGIARTERMPICQDTGLAVVFADIGQDVHIVGGAFAQAIDAGVRKGYVEGYLRKSSVAEPLFERKNTADNTPAVLHVRIVPGDALRIRVAPKGAGSENKGILKMLVPADGIEGVRKTVLDTVVAAGPSACPPMVVGVGIGGNMELACILAKRAAARDLTSANPDPRYAALEQDLLDMLNRTGIGPQGLGGLTTALAVHVEWAPTHIASLPVAVNINCHAARHAEVVL